MNSEPPFTSTQVDSHANRTQPSALHQTRHLIGFEGPSVWVRWRRAPAALDPPRLSRRPVHSATCPRAKSGSWRGGGRCEGCLRTRGGGLQELIALEQHFRASV